MIAADHVFPPALVPILRAQCAEQDARLGAVSDETLRALLTTVYFAGLETHEGEHRPVRVVFVGAGVPDLVVAEGAPGAIPLYGWRARRFEEPRPFTAGELAKLSVATSDDRLYLQTIQLEDHELAIAGITRKGIELEREPFLEVIAPRAGALSIRWGRGGVLEYEHGHVLSGGDHVVRSEGAVRRALEAAARAAGLGSDEVAKYLEAVAALVREMARHGRGGILVVAREEQPELPAGTSYRAVRGSSIATLIRVSSLIRHRPAPADSSESAAYSQLLRSAYDTEIERQIEELGALTAIDGATVLDRALGLVGFGVVLPVHDERPVVEIADAGSRSARSALASRGTRHRAASTYAGRHPGAVVFVASQDGHITCLVREPDSDHVLAHRIGPADAR